MTKERFTNKIKDDTYIKIATAIENVVSLDGDLDSFKKETQFNNFSPELYNKLVEDRKKSDKKLDIIGVKLAFAKIGKEKSLASLL